MALNVAERAGTSVLLVAIMFMSVSGALLAQCF